jgi:ribosome biogenesis GTPase A
MNKKCNGCGTTLQTTEPNNKGYIKEEKYKDSNYCERCYKIIHYNEKIITELDNINEYIIKEVNVKAQYAYFLIDFLNINSETIETFRKINVPKTLIISKLDIIPKSVKETKIINFLKRTYKIEEEILFQSTKKNINTRKIINNLSENNINEVYILGYTNAGKSTLINKLNELENTKIEPVTTSLIPNTTIDFIKIKLNNITIVDSPGFTLKNTLYKANEFDLIKKINPKSFLKPTTYQLKQSASLLIEDKIKITSSIANNYTLYISNDIKTDRIFDKNKILENTNKITILIPENSDLVIKSLGFINIKKECTLTIYSENKDLFEVRNSIFQKE